MIQPLAIVRFGLAILLGGQALAPFVHLALHAGMHPRCTTTCQAAAAEAAAEAASFAAIHAGHHACATCQWLTSNPGLTGPLSLTSQADLSRIPSPPGQYAVSAYPGFDYNVAIARGPPAFSLAAV